MKKIARPSTAAGKGLFKPRNPVAKALADPALRQRVVKDPKHYVRRPKHPAVPPSEDADE